MSVVSRQQYHMLFLIKVTTCKSYKVWQVALKNPKLCSGSCIHGNVSQHIQNMNLLSAALITWERMHQFLIFQSCEKSKQSSISTRGSLMYHERLWLLSLHLIPCLFSSHARKPVMGKLQKGETGRAPGPSEVLSKAFPFYTLSHRYSSCQLKSEDGKNLRLEKNFSTSKRHLATGLSFWKKEEKKPLKQSEWKGLPYWEARYRIRYCIWKDEDGSVLCC